MTLGAAVVAVAGWIDLLAYLILFEVWRPVGSVPPDCESLRVEVLGVLTWIAWFAPLIGVGAALAALSHETRFTTLARIALVANVALLPAAVAASAFAGVRCL